MLLLVLVASGCGDDSTSGTSATPTTSVVTTSPVTTSAATTSTVTTPPDTTSPATTSPVTTSPATTSPATTGPAANDLAGFGRANAIVGGEAVVVAVADTPELRGQGLMGVTELVDVDGMLFVFAEEVEAAFWMKDTLIPLDIWFFDSDGGFVDMLMMTPCAASAIGKDPFHLADPCETYPASGPFQYALETEVGRLPATADLELDLSG